MIKREITDSNTTIEINSKTEKKLIECAKNVKLSPDKLLETLIDDEIERQRLLNISNEIASENKKEKATPSQQISIICNKHLSDIDSESESMVIRKAIENLHNDLLKQNLISVNARKNEIVESKRLKPSRVAYYWYAGILAKRIGIWFGTLDVYLFHEILHPTSEVLFVGMPVNVEVCYQVFSRLYKVFKKIKSNYKKDAGHWGNKREMEEDANHYMYNFAQELDYTQAFIENDNFDQYLYEYADSNYSWAMRY